MKPRFLVASLLGAAAVTAVLTLPAAFTQGQQEAPERLMQMKLRHAQAILEGLTTEDFAKIEASGRQLLDLTRRAQWQAIKQPMYLRYSEDFRRTVQEMVDNARQRNLDGATLQYVQMTMACINCHKYMRRGDMLELPLQP